MLKLELFQSAVFKGSNFKWSDPQGRNPAQPDWEWKLSVSVRLEELI